MAATPNRELQLVAPGMTLSELRTWLGDTDIQLIDQLLHDRFPPGMRLLDAGCGDGRNLVYFLRAGYDVYGVDRAPRAVDLTRSLAARLAPGLAPERFQVGTLEQLSFPDAHFDAVIASAVLHFAADGAQFGRMVAELWRVLRPGGVLFARIASLNGMEGQAQPLGGGRYTLPDGSERFLVSEELLLGMTNVLGGELLDPLKTVIVHGQRCMATWVARKAS